MNKTKIDWCDMTLNPVVGCTFGCKYCYARTMNQRFGWIKDFSKPEPFIDRLKQLKIKTSKTIFMDSVSDIADWKDEWTAQTYEAIKENLHHSYLFLTKRPERYRHIVSVASWQFDAATLSDVLKKVWYGTTITCQSDVSRIQSFPMSLPNKFLSIEPLMEPIHNMRGIGLIDWVIIGAETGNRIRKVVPKKEWVEEITYICKGADIPVFMKSSLKEIMGAEFIQEMPDGLKNKQAQKILKDGD